MNYTYGDLKGLAMKVAAWVLAGWLAGAAVASAEVCTTQSQMKDADRDALAKAAASLAAKMQANDPASVKALTIADFQKDFSGMSDAIASTAPHLKGAIAEVEQIYTLDASNLTKTADAQFYCTLNQSTATAEFVIPQLPPGKYAFAMVRMESTAPWRLSYLLRNEGGSWLLAGFYPKELTSGGHDGLWYWTEARKLAANKEPWNAWLYLQEAEQLLYPANFVSSTHLDKLAQETTAAVPPAVSGGMSNDAPLVVKAADGSEFRFTGIAVEDAPNGGNVDVAAHIKVEALGDGTAARKRNLDAAAALIAAHPELRKAFHGVWVISDAPGASPYATELAMSEIR